MLAAAMGGAAIVDYGERLVLVRAGNAATGSEAFFNEGETDVPRALMALKKVGFNSLIRALSPLSMVGDSERGHKSRAYDLGYLKAILQTIESL